MEKEFLYEYSKIEKARIEGILTGLDLAMDLGDLGFVIRSRDAYEKLYKDLYIDPETNLDDKEK